MTSIERLKTIKGIGEKRFSATKNRMLELNYSVDDLGLLSPQQIKTELGLPIAIATSVFESFSKTQANEEPLSSTVRGVITLTPTHPKYPSRLTEVLKENAPQTIYAWGNLGLLDSHAVGFCGSRHVSPTGLAVTSHIVEQVAQLGWVIVSGHARGVDTVAHRTGLQNQTGTIIVLAEGINRFKLRTEIKSLATPENILILSEFQPNASWNVGYAMQRNSTIIALSDAMVVIEARTEGGTYNAGKTALKLSIPLFVAHYHTKNSGNSGNDSLIAMGGRKLSKSKTTDEGNIEPLKETVLQSHKNKRPLSE